MLGKIPVWIVLLCCFYASCKQPYHITQNNNQYYTISDTTERDRTLEAFLQPYKTGVDTQMSVILGYTDIPLTKAQPECTLGNFLADALLKSAQTLDSKVVAAVSNYGGIRVTYISPGNITLGKIYELMPFDNMVTIIEISGRDLQSFCDKIAANKGWPVSGLQFEIRNGKAENILINNAALKPSWLYKIAVNDYIANGGDNCEILNKQSKRYTSIFLRDALVNYIKELNAAQKPLHPVIEKRISYAN